MRGWFWIILLLCGAAWALAPGEVLVVANAKSAESLALAEHYLKARSIPAENLCRIETVTGYHCTRAEYETQIRVPVRDFLVQHNLAGKIRCIVLMWGVPVKIDWGSEWSASPDTHTLFETTADAAYRDLRLVEKLLPSVVTPGEGDATATELAHLFPAPLPDVADETLPVGKPYTAQTAGARAKTLSDCLTRVSTALRETEKALANLPEAQQPLARARLMALNTRLNGLPMTADFRKQEAAARDRLRWSAAPTGDVKILLNLLRDRGIAAVVQEYVAQCDPAGYRDAAVDNELALLWHGRYPLNGMQQNPLYWKARPGTVPEGAALPPGVAWPAVYLTARIDGPTAADATRLIDDAVAVEEVGLTGTVYLDAGGIYPYYDVHFRNLADLLKKHTTLKVVLDEKKELFAPDSCPDAALYCGWYRLRNYVPAFTWAKGAVGWHIASFEAADLRNPQTNEWCAKMIQGGVAATAGPVSEPYLHAFPLPEEFFPLLLTGKYSLVECFWRTLPNASWQMTLIGDPLYTPFKRTPPLTTDQLSPGLAL